MLCHRVSVYRGIETGVAAYSQAVFKQTPLVEVLSTGGGGPGQQQAPPYTQQDHYYDPYPNSHSSMASPHSYW